MDPAHSNTARLGRFAADVRFEAIPPQVVSYTKDLMVDWLGSVWAGTQARAGETISHFARTLGPGEGTSEVLTTGKGTSALFAAMINAESSHMVEQDDVHNASVFHPATVTFPAALATAQAIGASGRQLIAATIAGYKVGIQVGEFLGRSHYKVFHTTGTAGSLAATAAVGSLSGLDEHQMLHAFGSAGTQAAGLWEFLRNAADSKQLHTAHASIAGLTAAWLAKDGFTGAADILEGAQGLAAGKSTDADPR